MSYTQYYKSIIPGPAAHPACPCWRHGCRSSGPAPRASPKSYYSTLVLRVPRMFFFVLMHGCSGKQLKVVSDAHVRVCGGG